MYVKLNVGGIQTQNVKTVELLPDLQRILQTRHANILKKCSNSKLGVFW